MRMENGIFGYWRRKMITNFEFKGNINLKIEYSDGKEEFISFENSALKKGRISVAKSMIKDEPKSYITHVIFGDGGTENGKKKTVTSDLNNLFGTTRVVKPVIAQIDPDNQNRIILITAIEKDEGNNYTINEMAIKLNTDELISMATFKDINKNNTMRLAWTWILTF